MRSEQEVQEAGGAGGAEGQLRCQGAGAGAGAGGVHKCTGAGAEELSSTRYRGSANDSDDCPGCD